MNTGLVARIMRWRYTIGSSALFIALLFGVMTPWQCAPLPSHSQPAANYHDAVARIEQWQRHAPQPMNPDCLPVLLTHQRQTEHVIVLVHGYTSCPRQFYSLGQQFYQAGYNVFIAPLPHHGYADRLTLAHGQLTAAELTAYADRVLDIARGLGRRMDMMGLSAGGLVAAWAAQQRPDLDTAIMIAPAFAFKPIPLPFTAAAMNLYSLLPDAFVRWNPNHRPDDTPAYAYSHYSRHALTQLLRLSFSIQTDARQHAPVARRLVFVLNANDQSIRNEAALALAALWRERDQMTPTVIELPRELQLAHDVISRERPHQRSDIVYPYLLAAAGVTH